MDVEDIPPVSLALLAPWRFLKDAMGLADLLRGLFRGPDTGRGVDDLARRLGLAAADLQATPVAYREFEIPKRSGGRRRIAAPEPPLKALQKRILRRLLDRLEAHPAATGFEHCHSIATNALCHAGQAVVLRMDIKDFFPSTTERRVRDWFHAIGWNRDASSLLTRLVTHRGGLPQGAPTSPRISNLVNHRLDARLEGLARKVGASYTRYADDMTFSFRKDDRAAIHSVIRATKAIVAEDGYALHQDRKLQVRRRHEQQRVTGLVVNAGVRLPRETRRRLRAVEHHLRTGKPATLTAAQLAGWKALQLMIGRQVDAARGGGHGAERGA
jgi:RNA-directed DNA polymerase